MNKDAKSSAKADGDVEKVSITREARRESHSLDAKARWWQGCDLKMGLIFSTPKMRSRCICREEEDRKRAMGVGGKEGRV